MKVILNMKYDFFEMIEQGYKTHEYRESKSYWNKRFKDLKKNDIIEFRCGYTNKDHKVYSQIISICKIPFWLLPDYAKVFFRKSKYRLFYDIHFELVEQ